MADPSGEARFSRGDSHKPRRQGSAAPSRRLTRFREVPRRRRSARLACDDGAGGGDAIRSRVGIRRPVPGATASTRGGPPCQAALGLWRPASGGGFDLAPAPPREKRGRAVAPPVLVLLSSMVPFFALPGCNDAASAGPRAPLQPPGRLLAMVPQPPLKTGESPGACAEKVGVAAGALAAPALARRAPAAQSPKRTAPPEPSHRHHCAAGVPHYGCQRGDCDAPEHASRTADAALVRRPVAALAAAAAPPGAAAPAVGVGGAVALGTVAWPPAESGR
mgnify:CR=1 FL=1